MLILPYILKFRDLFHGISSSIHKANPSHSRLSLQSFTPYYEPPDVDMGFNRGQEGGGWGPTPSHRILSRAQELVVGLWALVTGTSWTGKAPPATSSWTFPTGKNHTHFSSLRSHEYLFYLPQELFLPTNHKDSQAL